MQKCENLVDLEKPGFTYTVSGEKKGAKRKMFFKIIILEIQCSLKTWGEDTESAKIREGRTGQFTYTKAVGEKLRTEKE